MYTLHKTEGIILRVQEVGEADKLLTVFTRDFGKITLRARGVRLQNSKLKAHLDVMTCSRLVFVSGREVLRLTDAEEAVNYFPRFSGRARALAAFALRLIDRLVQGSEKDEALWELLTGFFAALEMVSAPAPVLQDVFAVRTLIILGYVERPAGELGIGLAGENWGEPVFSRYAAELSCLCEGGISASHL